MNKEELYNRITDVGLEDESLNIILNKMLNNEYFDIRKFSLPEDKKVLKVKPFSETDNTINLHNILIFKTLVRKICDSSYERFQKFGIDKNLLLKLKSLNSDELIGFYKSCKTSKNNKSLDNFLAIIRNMSLINNSYGSHQVDLFEDKIQETIYKSGKGKVEYTKRIYLNIPLNKIGVEFLTLYKLKCIEKGIPSKMKGMGSLDYDEGKLDTTILYSNDYYLLDHINILESIIRERPDLVNNFGSPVISGGRVKSKNGECYYTISTGILADRTSNDYYSKLYYYSFVYLCSKYVNIEPKYDIKSLCELKLKEFGEYRVKVVNLLNDEIKQKIINDGHFKEVVCNFASYLKFGDIKHLDVPLYQDEVFVNYFKDVKKTIKIESTSEEDLYLNHTEDLIENSKIDFLNSKKSNIDRVIEYKNNLDKIMKLFRSYSVKTKGFVFTDRYKEVVTYFKTLPQIKIFTNDNTKGSGINFVNAKKYYNEVASSLEEAFNKTESKKI